MENILFKQPKKNLISIETRDLGYAVYLLTRDGTLIDSYLQNNVGFWIIEVDQSNASFSEYIMGSEAKIQDVLKYVKLLKRSLNG